MRRVRITVGGKEKKEKKEEKKHVIEEKKEEKKKDVEKKVMSTETMDRFYKQNAGGNVTEIPKEILLPILDSIVEALRSNPAFEKVSVELVKELASNAKA